MRTPTIEASPREHAVRGRPRTSRVATVSRVLELIDQQHWPLRLADLCRVTGISERTLRTIIKEQFDLGPSRYLRLRRLQMLHDALQRASPYDTTVAAISARLGYAHGGRMASEYHELFGEYPSQTLGHPFAQATDESTASDIFATLPEAGPDPSREPH